MILLRSLVDGENAGNGAGLARADDHLRIGVIHPTAAVAPAHVAQLRFTRHGRYDQTKQMMATPVRTCPAEDRSRPTGSVAPARHEALERVNLRRTRFYDNRT